MHPGSRSPDDRSLPDTNRFVDICNLAEGHGNSERPFDGKDVWKSFAEGKSSPHEDILINVEFFRGAIRKGQWKLMKMATLPGKTELFDLSKDPGEKANITDQFPEVVADLEARLVAYAREQKTSLWLKAQKEFMGFIDSFSIWSTY